MATNEAKLASAILAELATKADGAEASSFLHRCLRAAGWRGLGCLADFEFTCLRLGFIVREGRNERNQRRIEVAL